MWITRQIRFGGAFGRSKTFFCATSVTCLVWEPQNLGLWHFGWRPEKLWKLALKGVFRLISGVRGQGVANHCFRTESTLRFWVNLSIIVFTMQTCLDTENYATCVVRARKSRYKSWLGRLRRLCEQICHAIYAHPGKPPRNPRLTRQRVRYIFDTIFSRPLFTIQILRMPRVTVRMCSVLEKHETKAAFV